MKRIKIAKFEDCFHIREICKGERTVEVTITAEDEAVRSKMKNTLEGIASLTNGELKPNGEDSYQMVRGMTYIGDVLEESSRTQVSVEMKTEDDMRFAEKTLKSGQPLCVDLSEMETEDAKRSFDRLSAMDYYLEGQIDKLNSDTFLYMPEKKVYDECDDTVILEYLARAKALYQEPEEGGTWMDEFTQIFTAAVAHMKDNQIVSPAALLYAQLLEEMGQTDSAMDVLKDYADWCLRGSMDKHDYYILSLMKLSRYYYKEKNYIEAEKYLKPLQDRNARRKIRPEGNRFFLQIYTKTLVQNGKRNEMKTMLKQRLQEFQNPVEQIEVKTNLAGFYREEGLFWKAVPMYKRIIKDIEQMEDGSEKIGLLLNAKMDIADALMPQGKYKATTSYLEECLALCGKDRFAEFRSLTVNRKLGLCYRKAGETEKAASCYKNMIKWYEEHPGRNSFMGEEPLAAAYRLLGEQYFIQKHYTEAARAFEKSWEIYRANSKDMYSFAEEILFLQEYIVELSKMRSR